MIHHAVLSLGERCSNAEDDKIAESLVSLPITMSKNSQYSEWPQRVLNLGLQLSIDLDIVRRHHVCELYSSGLDKLAEEVSM